MLAFHWHSVDYKEVTLLEKMTLPLFHQQSIVNGSLVRAGPSFLPLLSMLQGLLWLKWCAFLFVCLSILIREVPFFSWWWITQRPTSYQSSKKWRLLGFSYQWGIHITPSSQGSEIIAEAETEGQSQRWWTTPAKAIAGQIRPVVHMNSFFTL